MTVLRYSIATCIAILVAVWMGIAYITMDDAPVESPVTTTVSVLDLGAVQAHATAASCWTIIDGSVYDITSYIPLHPGGKQAIMQACGTDGSQLFNTKGGEGHSPAARTLLAKYALGKLNEAPTASAQSPGTITPSSPSVPKENPTQSIVSGTDDEYDDDDSDEYDDDEYEDEEDEEVSTGEPLVVPAQPPATVPSQASFTAAQVATHNSAANCWVIVSGGVYDVTEYIPYHPGGASKISRRCGRDITSDFNSVSDHRRKNAMGVLEPYAVGTLA